jgi:hypothetical protein
MRRSPRRETEATFQRAVCELAALGDRHWRVYHPYLRQLFSATILQKAPLGD